MFMRPRPETGEELEFVDDPPEGFEPNDLPPQPAVLAPGCSPEEIREIAGSLRQRAGPAGWFGQPNARRGDHPPVARSGGAGP